MGVNISKSGTGQQYNVALIANPDDKSLVPVLNKQSPLK